MKVARVTLSFPDSVMTVVEFHREPDKIQQTFIPPSTSSRDFLQSCNTLMKGHQKIGIFTV